MVYDLVPGSEEGTVAQQQGCPATQRHDSLHPPLHTFDVRHLRRCKSFEVHLAVHQKGLYVPARGKAVLQQRQHCMCTG